jgi:hypothetical protein
MRRKAWLVFAAMLGLLGLAGPVDGFATTAVISPGGAVTASAGASTFTWVTAGKVANCTTTSFTAILRGGTFTGFPFQASSTLQMAFGGPCTVTGGIGITLPCNPGQSFNLAGLTAGMSTAGRIGIDCFPKVNGTTCRVEIIGSVPVAYANTGNLAILTTGSPGQLLIAQGSDDGRGSRCTSLPVDTRITFTDASGNPLVMAVSPVQTITVT